MKEKVLARNEANKMNNKMMLAVMVLSAVVNGVYASGTNNLVGGTDNVATANSAAVFGYQNTIDANNAIAFGENNVASGTNAFVGGNNSKATGRNTFAYGSHAEALVEYTTAIGSQARTSAYNTLAIGNGSYASGPSALAIGTTTKSQSDNTIALGSSVTTSLNNSIGIGSVVNANGVSSVAIGHTVSTEGTSAVNIGNANVGASKYSTLIGSYNTVDHADHLENPEGDVLIGNANIVQDGYYAMALGKDNKINNANYAIAIGNNSSVTKDESIAIGHEAKANTVIGTASAVINNNTYNFVGSTPIGTVSIGDTGKERTLTNVSAGIISDTSTDAINGSQLFATINEINVNGQQISSLKSRVDSHGQRLDYLQNSLIDHEGRIQILEQDNKDINSSVSNTQNQVNINTKDIADLKGKIGTNTTDIKNELNNRINVTEKRMNKLGASSAALAGLHPMEFNKDDKFSASVAYGHYNNANAVALGLYYRPNEKILLGIAGAFGSENMYNVSASFKFGKHSEYEPQSKQGEIESMKAQIAELTARLDAVSK